jgi:hypothetical protein
VHLEKYCHFEQALLLRPKRSNQNPKEKVQKEKQQSTKHKKKKINLRHIFVSLFCENIIVLTNTWTHNIFVHKKMCIWRNIVTLSRLCYLDQK